MKAVFFDWNGTIFNDVHVWFGAIEEIFRVFQKTPPTPEQYFRELENDYMEIYRKRGITASRDRLNQIYEPYYWQHVHACELYPKTVAGLDLLRQKGILLGLITLQKEELAIPILEKFGIKQHFSYFNFEAYNKAQIIQDFLKNHKISLNNCFYVGDAPSDVRHAKKAGVQAVAFLNNFIPKDLIAATNPDYVITDISELLDIVEQ